MATLECVTDALDLLMRCNPQGASKITDFEKTAQAWWLILEPLPDEVVQEAAVHLARRGSQYGFFQVGDVYDRAADLVDPEPSVEEAWALVVKHSRNASLGDNNPVKLEGRTASALAAIGGDLGWLVDEMPFRKKEFVEQYGKMKAEWKSAGAPDPGRLLADGKK